jgi:dsRNA-specific ribonuclease
MHSIMMNEGLIQYSYHDNYFYKDNPPENEKVADKQHDPYIEAIAAAIYRDGGWESVTDWFHKWLLPLLKKHKDILPQKITKDPDCELNEWCQKNHVEFDDKYSKQGPDHKPLWTCVLTLQDWTTHGTGTDQKKAKKEAARDMLKIINNQCE